MEACCTSLEAAVRACQLGFGRIELCEDLKVGGVTPSVELFRKVHDAVTIPVNVLIRPRGGDFVYDTREVEIMCQDIRQFSLLGAHGVVIGALDKEGRVDMEIMERLVALSRSLGLSVTFHRAFDESRDALEALDAVLKLGCDRLLTSGHAQDAFQGRSMIRQVVMKASGRLVVMAGCGVRPTNIEMLERDSQAQEFHSSFLSEDYFSGAL